MNKIVKNAMQYEGETAICIVPNQHMLLLLYLYYVVVGTVFNEYDVVTEQNKNSIIATDLFLRSFNNARKSAIL